MFNTKDYNNALILRNKKWSKNDNIPSWVNTEEVGLDQFFTKPEIAKKCYFENLHVSIYRNMKIFVKCFFSFFVIFLTFFILKV